LARVLYEPPIGGRIASIIILFGWHWAVLRFWTQGPAVPRGTFTAEHNAISYIYAQPWWIWRNFEIGSWITMSWKGLMSVPPAAATMLLGTIIGDWIRRGDLAPPIKASRLALCALMLAILGFLWAFDLPFNKPRWTPAYLVYALGIGAFVLAILYAILDLRGRGAWCYPLVVFGVNAIAAYFIPILAKVVLLNMPRVRFAGEATPLINAILLTLKSWFGAWAGGWAFTIGFVAFWWFVFHLAYRRKLVWKL
jgi:predicted acyltransferase